MYSCCFVGCCFQDLFKIDCNILLLFPFNFFSVHFVSFSMIHLYSGIDIAIAWKKSRFILSTRSDFRMIDNLSIAIHVFARQIYIYIYIHRCVDLLNNNTFFRSDIYIYIYKLCKIKDCSFDFYSICIH